MTIGEFFSMGPEIDEDFLCARELGADLWCEEFPYVGKICSGCFLANTDVVEIVRHGESWQVHTLDVLDAPGKARNKRYLISWLRLARGRVKRNFLLAYSQNINNWGRGPTTTNGRKTVVKKTIFLFKMLHKSRALLIFYFYFCCSIYTFVYKIYSSEKNMEKSEYK